jgi:sugar phosphate isomerase/epimerase
MASRKLDRRTFFGAAAGVAGATALGPWAPGLSLGHDKGREHGKRIVPRNRLGVQQFSIRDSITRLDQSVSGYLGGPNLPADATDVGPLVPLPGGFRAVFDYLASVGYNGFEFFSFNQGANAPITNEELRTALDNAGLNAAGTHIGGLQAMSVPANIQAQIDLAGIFGYRMVGTAGNPANPTLGTLAAWQGYAEQANTVGAAFRAAGIKYFFHPEQDWFRFFDDPAHPELARAHRIDWFTDNTDPKLVHFEPDTMHTLAGRARFPDPVDGRLFDVNAWYGRLAAQDRLIAWHAKDADRVIPMPAPGVKPVHADTRATGLPAQRRRRRGLCRRGLDLPRLPGRPRPRGPRVRGPVRPLRARQPRLVPRGERQRSRPAGHRSGPIAALGQGQRRLPSQPERGRSVEWVGRSGLPSPMRLELASSCRAVAHATAIAWREQRRAAHRAPNGLTACRVSLLPPSSSGLLDQCEARG